MRKKQNTRQSPVNLRKCISNQMIRMEIIPEISPQPYFTRKQNQQGKLVRGNSLNSRKNKLIDNKKIQTVKERLLLDKEKVKLDEQNKNKLKKANSPFKIQKFPVQNSMSELQTNVTVFPLLENISDNNFSDQKVSSSCKSVRFSNRLDDNKSIYTKRQGSRTPSILKNKNKKNGKGSILSSIPSQRSFSINHSFHSNHKQMKKKIAEQSNANNLIKKKYQSLFKSFQAKQKKFKPPLPGKKFGNLMQNSDKQKFKDDLFPPIYSSAFPYNPKVDQRKGKQIQWMRISQIFPNQKLTIFDRPEAVPKYFDINKQQSKVAKIVITKQKTSYASDYILSAFNAIKNNQQLLSKIFESQQINDYGIYMLKIYQQNQWKYIIIDDYIPVIKSNLVNTQNPYIPAFVNIKPQINLNSNKKNKNSKSEQFLPIWPFLLEKAYASYYSSYQALTFGNTLDLTQQFCGLPPQKINLIQKTDAQEYLQVIDKLLLILKNGNMVVLAQLKQTLPMIPLYYKAQFCYSMITQEQLTYYDPHDEYKPCKIKFYDLGLICTHLYLFSPTKFLNQIRCTISKPRHKMSPNLIKKVNKQDDIIPRDIPSIRKFKLNSACQLTIFICQKDNRFLYRIGINYIWIRVMLIGVQYDGSYRWIDGEYSNKKFISFHNLLDQGQYLLLIWPEWSKQKYNHQIHLTVFSNQEIPSLERVAFDPKAKIVEHACMDLAQKRGKLNQINKFICSYNYLDKKCALIIENINNQRLHGQVNIVRSILGLQSKVQIVPVNDQFFQDLKQNKKQEGAQYLAIKKNTIDVKIPKDESFTVVLKMRGGIDQKFFKAFTFGS